MGMTMHMATLMNRSKSNGGKSAGTANLILAFGLVAAIASTGYHWIATQHEFDMQDRAAPTVFADPRAKGNDAVAIVAAQMHELTWRPLSQNALNRLLVAARLSGQRALEDRVATVMRSFAWRTAPGQLNLINIAIERQRFDDIFPHADALARRGKAVEEMLAIFALFEQIPEQRQFLVNALKQSPPWRQAFLASAERLKTPSEVQARYATITGLLETGQVQRDELSSLLGRMVATGSAAQAHALWTKTQIPAVTPDRLFDPGFKQAMALQRSATPIRFPFEWQLDTGGNAGTQLIEREGRNELQLYWNGQGIPIFAKQTFEARPGFYRATLTGVNASSAARRTLAIELLCAGEQPVRLLPVRSAGESELSYSAEAATRCSFPEIRIYARSDNNNGHFEMSLTGINLALKN